MELNNKERQEQLKNLVDILNNSLSSEVPLDFSVTIDPLRAVVFREACLHRIAEISESAYQAFAKDNLIVALILSRAVMETEALYWGFISELEEALKSRNIERIRKFLTGCLIGVKSPQLKLLKSPENVDLIIDPTNILTFIDKMSKKITHYRLHYDSLSEFSNPNAAGTVDAYVSLDHEARVARLGKNRAKLVPELALPQLIGSLTMFLECVDESTLCYGPPIRAMRFWIHFKISSKKFFTASVFVR
jgi:hypothetical protein